MSRRTKLTVLAIFLVLLAIPVLYVALTWYPSQSLRFRLEHLYPGEHRDDRGHRMLRVSIQNPNPMPVHLLFVRLNFERSMPDLKWVPPGYIDPRFQKENGIAASQDVLILPPGSTTHVTAFLQPELVDEALREGMIADSTYMAQTKYRAAMAYTWLHELLPESIRTLLPLVDCPSHTAPVEPPTD